MLSPGGLMEKGPQVPAVLTALGWGWCWRNWGFVPRGHTAGDAMSYAVGKEPAPACFSTDLGAVQPVPSSSCCPSVSFALCDGNEKSPNLQPPTYVLLPTRSG